MSILHLSDTHAQHHKMQNLPKADVIIHSGDITLAGTGEEVTDFIDWFDDLDYRHKIFVAGNHDDCLDGKNIQSFLPDNMYYLCESGVEIDGIKFWGIPYFISYELRMEKYQYALDTVPRNTNVLITHRPPLGILDRSGHITFGCPDLLQKVLEIKPKYHLFGHIHDAYGSEKSHDTAFYNSAVLNERYDFVNKPVTINL
ncbi:MAG: metallophosphatase domain-containing protein [Prevotellaceae bacterium]|jgi:Icc-related predicted phosphoesterase|nr:metallophosphatase domain-containing protein [Prevotellaceae bacterium]